MDSWLVFRRAFKDTWQFFGWNWRTLLGPISFIFGTVIYRHYFGNEAAREEVNVAISYILAPFGLFAILLFVWNVFLAPFRILAEKNVDGMPAINKGPVNYEAWDQTNTFQLFQAACLWADKNPNPDCSSGDEYIYLRVLKEAWNNGELKSNTATARRQTSIHFSAMRDVEFVRKDLVTFAEKRKMKPPFLFPEERK